MKLITERTLIRGVADRWRKQYPAERYPEKVGIAVRLDRLNKETATASDVADIIGNESWTRLPSCDECGTESAAKIVEVGAEPDYESNTARLCGDCVMKAMRLLSR